jgi:hypothetical protein
MSFLYTKKASTNNTRKRFGLKIEDEREGENNW